MPQQALQKLPYDSFKMLNKDGQFMCYVSEKRANWYVSRNLADFINPKTFQLNFTSKGNGKNNDAFYNQPVSNICVVCGSTDLTNLTRHHIVPYVFRSRFPKEMKNRNNHDILPLCIECHEKYEQFATMYKKDFEQKIGVNINQTSLTKEQRYNNTIISAQKALKRATNKEITIPYKRLQELQIIACKPLIEVPETQQKFWADAIMQNITTKEQLYQFIVSWRKHFVQYANPQYLPEHWDVNKEIEYIG